MYEEQDFVWAEMNPAVGSYKRFSGNLEHLVQQINIDKQSLYFLHDPVFQTLVESGYSLLLRHCTPNKIVESCLYENTRRPSDNEARILVVDLTKIVYIHSNFFYTTYTFGSVKKTKWNSSAVFGAAMATCGLFFLALRRHIR